MAETVFVNADKNLELLRKRAKQLAKEEEAGDQSEERIEIVEFLLTGEHYAIESTYISEVYPLKEFTPLPGTPAFVLGLINVRGKILSVIDLRRFFDLPDQGFSDLNKIIILKNRNMEFGILADSILAARQLSVDHILTSLPTLTEIRSEYLMGVTEERLVVLDGYKLLSDRKLLVQAEA